MTHSLPTDRAVGVEVNLFGLILPVVVIVEYTYLDTLPVVVVVYMHSNGLYSSPVALPVECLSVKVGE